MHPTVGNVWGPKAALLQAVAALDSGLEQIHRSRRKKGMMNAVINNYQLMLR
jgi:hypothetical protein